MSAVTAMCDPRYASLGDLASLISDQYPTLRVVSLPGRQTALEVTPPHKGPPTSADPFRLLLTQQATGGPEPTMVAQLVAFNGRLVASERIDAVGLNSSKLLRWIAGGDDDRIRMCQGLDDDVDVAAIPLASILLECLNEQYFVRSRACEYALINEDSGTVCSFCRKLGSVFSSVDEENSTDDNAYSTDVKPEMRSACEGIKGAAAITCQEAPRLLPLKIIDVSKSALIRKTTADHVRTRFARYADRDQAASMELLDVGIRSGSLQVRKVTAETTYDAGECGDVPGDALQPIVLVNGKPLSELNKSNSSLKNDSEDEDYEDDEEDDEEEESSSEDSDEDDEESAPSPPRRKRGRPPKEKSSLQQQQQQQQSTKVKTRRGRPAKTAATSSRTLRRDGSRSSLSDQKPDVMRQCQVCLFKHSKPHIFDKHFETHLQRYDLDSPVTCPVCRQTFKTKYELNPHFQEAHGKEHGCCIECLEVVEVQKLKRHLTYVHYILPKNKLCPHCGDAFKNRQDLEIHIAIQHDKTAESCICDHCGKIFPHAKLLGKHIQTSHVYNNKGLFKCPFCEKIFDKSHAWHKHLKIHSKNKPYRCGWCDYRSVNRFNVRLHMRKRHREDASYEDLVKEGGFDFGVGEKLDMESFKVE